MTPLTPIEIARMEELRQAVATVDIAGEGEPVGGGWMAFASPGSWANQACALGLNGPVPESDLDRLVDFYVRRGVEPRIEVCAFADDTLLRGLADRRFVVREFENVMARPLRGEESFRDQHPHAWNPDWRIERVDPTNDAAVDAHVRVAMSGFVDEVSEAMLETGRNTVRHPKSVAFDAFVDGKHAGAAAMEVGDPIAAFFGTSVRPEFRRQGLQAALLLTRLEVARDAGCTLGVIHSRPGIPTERNAARVGFTLAYTKVAMVQPGEGLEPSP